MHISLSPPSSPPEVRTRRALLEADLAWLREELGGAKSSEQKASLLYQIGVLEQLAERDPLAVRQLLAAVNTVAHFKEPLERLIALIERHRSFKNLPMLLEHLCRSAEGNAEVARAELAHAWCMLLHAREPVKAVAMVDAALAASPRDPGALLTRELLARRLADGSRLELALAARLESARDPGWAVLLGQELAARYASAGHLDGANELLLAAAARPTALALGAIEQRFELGRRAARNDWMLEALEARSTRILAALDAPDAEARALCPSTQRDRSCALDALLLQAELERSAGRGAEALATLERAQRLDPGQPLAVHALLEHAERLGRADLVEPLVKSELEAEPSAAEAADLWLRLAESHARSGRAADSLAALRQVLGLEPRCWLARGRELELSIAQRDAEGLARGYAQLARDVGDSVARGRYWLASADVWSRQAKLGSFARDAMEQAERNGVPAVMARRVERALAQLCEDRAWYDSATRRLLNSDVEDGERIGLELESFRRALLDGDGGRAREGLIRLEAASAGRRAASLARAYLPDDDGSDALAQLCELAGDGERSAALGWALALRLRAAGDVTGAIERLARIHSRHPRHAALAGTLSTWLRERGEPLAAAEVLRASAAALEGDAFAASLAVEAGLSSWWAGERDAARRDFDSAERPARGGRSGTLAEWTRRAEATPGSEPEGTLEPDERLFAALERLTSKASPSPRELNELTATLRAVGDGGDDDGLVAAALLANLGYSRQLGVRVEPAALQRVLDLDPQLASLGTSFRFLEQISQAEPSPRALEESARRWSDEGGGLPAALEWLAASARLGQRRLEHAARLRVSEQLSDPGAEHARASAALVAHLTQAEPAELVPGQTPAARLTNLETSPPGCDPERRARALEGVGDLLGADAEPIVSLLKGYNQLAAADVEGAIGSFRRYTDAFPDDPSGWEGLLAAARRGDDPALLAEAASTLGSTCRDPAHAARLFEEAAEIFIDRLGDEVAGQAALTRAVQLDITRTSSFTRLYQSLRQTASVQELVGLVERRLPHAASSSELVQLHWELARGRRQQGDIDGALAALDVVTDHDPDHLGAMALYGEIFISTQRYPEAVDRLARLSERSDAPPEHRLKTGLAAVDLCENQLGTSARALEILAQLERAGLATLGVSERLARSAAKAGDHERAAHIFERLMFERETDAQRAEAARLALAIHRDRREDAEGAGRAAQRLLELLPGDAEGLDFVLGASLAPSLIERLLERGRAELMRRTAAAPTDVDALNRLARIAERLDDVPLRQAMLGALVALGHSPGASRAELVSLERRISTIPPSLVSSDVLAGLADPEDTGPISELMSFVGPYIGETFGPPRQAFSVSRKERVSDQAGEPLREEISAWVAAFGLPGFDLYLSPVASERLVVLGTEPLTIIAGASVTAPLGPFQRQALARALYAVKRGLGPLLSLDEADVRALIAALCSVGGVALSGPVPARQRDFEQQLVKALPRKLRKLLPVRARSVRDAEASLDVWVRAAGASLDRVAAVAVGDASVILADAPAREAPSGAHEERARRLLGFMLSPQFETLRQQFGVIVR